MKKYLLVTFLSIWALTTYAQTVNLSGEIIIKLSKGLMSSDFRLTNLTTTSSDVSFMINTDIKVTTVLVNGKKRSFQKIKRKCFDCKIYSIKNTKNLNVDDSLQILTQGTFKKYKQGKNTSDYKGRIAINYGILRASEQSKWYPTLVDLKSSLPDFLQKKSYNFDFRANCDDCEHIYIGEGTPQKSGNRFSSQSGLENIMLIVGDYNWSQGKNALFLNVKKEETSTLLDSLFSQISKFYTKKSGVKLPSQFTYAHLPSDNRNWGGFMTYPTIVNVSKNINKRGLEPYLAHEVAHYLFGNVYKAKSNLLWFYLESFAEYFSYKYLAEYNPQALSFEYFKLKKSINFVRLDKVEKFNEVTNQHRYVTGAFQLLALENKIGEVKMMNLIKLVFTELESNENGYKALINSLSKLDISDDEIESIENSIFKKFDIQEYSFVDDLIKN